ncbi:MAG: phenylacetate--CoA ligase family protein [Nitrospirae bacterium]|nr:phenylacetate--CoA ligase family protein [Nitrospirota bacterium]
MKPLVKNILLPLHEFLKGHDSLTCLHEMERSQWCSEEQLSRIRSEKMQGLLRHAVMNVPYYRRLFDVSRTDLNSIRSMEDLKKLPFLTKDLIRENPEALKSEKCRKFIRSNTGGSTGAPMVFYLGQKRISADIAAKLRATRWWGVDIGDREIVIWGSPVELTKQDLIRQVRDRLFNTRLLSAFEMSEATMLKYLHVIKKYRPRHVFGYPSSIYLLCIANGYGGRDLGFIAHECPLGGMHITAESVIVEIVDLDGNVLAPGKRGEIVITHLDSHDFPFIRYRSGDIGILSEETCSCGRGLPLLKEIEGRTTDFIITPDGKIMHGLSLIYVMRDIAGISEFKIIQESTDNFIINIVKGASFNPESEALIKQGFKKRIGADVKIDFDYVSKLYPERNS